MNFCGFYHRILITIFSILLYLLPRYQTQFVRTLSSHERSHYKYVVIQQYKCPHFLILICVFVFREKISSMFYHAYDSYLQYASGYDELKPISCSGMNTWGTFSLSLIDALDTLAVMGNYSEFRRVANHIIETATFEA